MGKINLRFGALAEPISEQVRGRIPLKEARRFDKDADAITRLYLRGYLTDGQTRLAREHLANAISEAIKESDRSRR